MAKRARLAQEHPVAAEVGRRDAADHRSGSARSIPTPTPSSTSRTPTSCSSRRSCRRSAPTSASTRSRRRSSRAIPTRARWRARRPTSSSRRSSRPASSAPSRDRSSAWRPRSSRATAARCRARWTRSSSCPGVGRKTANVVLGHALGVPGLPVDRHVLRVANRIGIAQVRRSRGRRAAAVRGDAAGRRGRGRPTR